MNFTHTNMASAIADVAKGRVSFARWSAGEGWTSTAEKGRKAGSVVVRSFNPDGSAVAASTLSRGEVRGYAERAEAAR